MVVNDKFEIEKDLSGDFLYGEDFNDAQTEQWFREEINAYASIGRENHGGYQYSYHGVNIYHGFKHLPKNKEKIRVLSIGGYYGDELLPIIEKISEIFILEPSNSFINKTLNNVKITYLMADPSGKIPIETNSIDLITCFGALHHMPKIMPILGEINRTLKPNALAMIREPIVSMGDWSKKRIGLTKNERGIPLNIFRQSILNNNFNIIHERLCFFLLSSYLVRLFSHLKISLYNFVFFAFWDDLVCNQIPWNIRYHPQTLIKKIQPSCVFFVIQKGKSENSP
jgi:SAM-dependent methyltransferase